MNLIPPIPTNPVAPLPGNGLEPGDNPLAGIEGPIFYDELVAALAKGASGEVGASLTDSAGDSAFLDGETPQGDLQGLPAEVTSQLIDQANFSPVVLQQAAALTAVAANPADASPTAGATSGQMVTAVAAQSSSQAAMAKTMAAAAAPLGAEGGTNTQDQMVVASVDSQSQVETSVSETKISTGENLETGTASARLSTVKAGTDDLPTAPAGLAATGLAATAVQSGQAQDLNVREAISDQAAQDAKVSAASNQQAVTATSADLSRQRMPGPSDVSMPATIGQEAIVESVEVPSPIVTATNTSTRSKGALPEDIDLSATSPSVSITMSDVVEAPSIKSNFGLRVIGTPQSVERGVSASSVSGESWQGLIPSSSALNRAVVSPVGAGEGANLDGPVDLSIMSTDVQAPAATEGFGDWRFSVRPNAANPIDKVALPADVAVQLEQGAAPITNPISDLVSDDVRVMTAESDLRLDPSVRSPAREAVIDDAAMQSSRNASDRVVDAIASQSASAESRASLDTAKSDFSSTTSTRETASGLSNSIAEKFVSTLLGISGLPLESAADRTAIEFRHVRTIVAAPHMARWDAAAVQVELVRLVRDGGGQIVMKLTPPDEGSFKIDLSLDPDRGIRIFVEGASDSVRTRLEQGAEQLREQFSQMGFNLQLDMHSRREASGQPAGFGFAESGSRSESGDGRSAAAEQGSDGELPAAVRRKSVVDESRVYFRA